MNRRISLIVGFLLIAIGVAALGMTLVTSWLGLTIWELGIWRLWPLSVTGLGACLGLMPLLMSHRRGLGGLFIPSLPVLTTGGILLFASVWDAWQIWAYAWPLELLALAIGFLLAAWRMDVVGLVVPAIIVGANGLIFQFCALTGWWAAWAVLWALEPLVVGLALLALNLRLRRRGLFLAGLILCGIASVGLLVMPILVTSQIWVSLLGPVLLVGLGLVLILRSARSSRAPETT